MPLVDILVHVNSDAGCESRIEAACTLAVSHGAHVTGLFVLPEIIVPYLAEGAFISEDLWKTQNENAARRCESAKTLFETVCNRTGTQAEWRQEQGPASGTIIRHTRYSDIVIVDRGNETGPVESLNMSIAADVIMDSGRPVLVKPETSPGDRPLSEIVLCWNTSREAVRAITDSMPLLASADRVTVLSVNPDTWSGGDHGEIPGADIGRFLARHGIKVETATSSGKGDVGQIILSRAREIGADLIVCGGYGHSRTREWVLGGVTDTLLTETTIPVLMSH